LANHHRLLSWGVRTVYAICFTAPVGTADLANSAGNPDLARNRRSLLMLCHVRQRATALEASIPSFFLDGGGSKELLGARPGTAKCVLRWPVPP
jgi:hypothetical protein